MTIPDGIRTEFARNPLGPHTRARARALVPSRIRPVDHIGSGSRKVHFSRKVGGG